jgi:hypothetical protein
MYEEIERLINVQRVEPPTRNYERCTYCLARAPAFVRLSSCPGGAPVVLLCLPCAETLARYVQNEFA